MHKYSDFTAATPLSTGHLEIYYTFAYVQYFILINHYNIMINQLVYPEQKLVTYTVYVLFVHFGNRDAVFNSNIFSLQLYSCFSYPFVRANFLIFSKHMAKTGST